MSVPANGRYQAWAGQPKGYPRDEKRCWEQVFPGRGLHHQCGKPWSAERSGERFCTQHDPVAVAKRRAEREAEWDAKADAESERWKRQAAERAACEGVDTKDLKRWLLAKLLSERAR